MALLDFGKIFQVNIDATHVGIGAVLSQDGRPISHFSEKLSGDRVWYSTYDIKLYAIVQTLRHWWHYLLQREFILYYDHEALKYISR